MFSSLNELHRAREILTSAVSDDALARRIIAATFGESAWDTLVKKIENGPSTYTATWSSSARCRYEDQRLPRRTTLPPFDEVFTEDSPIPAALLESLGDEEAAKRIAAGRRKYHFELAQHQWMRAERDARIIDAPAGALAEIGGYSVELVCVQLEDNTDSQLVVSEWSALMTYADMSIATASGTLIRSRRGRELKDGEALYSADVYSDYAVALVEALTRKAPVRGQFFNVEYLHVLPYFRRRGVATLLLAASANGFARERKRPVHTSLLLTSEMFSDARHFPNLSPSEHEAAATALLDKCFADRLRALWNHSGHVVVTPSLRILGRLQTMHLAAAASSGEDPHAPIPSEDALLKFSLADAHGGVSNKLH